MRRWSALIAVFAAGTGCLSDAGAGEGGGEGGAPAVDPCGNGVPDRGEACDDGKLHNGTRGSRCTPLCTISTCDDGFAHPDEPCQPGETGCTDDCRRITCGDGFTDRPTEACDPPGEFCSAACELLPGCGNGQVEPGLGEECELSTSISGCRADCTLIRCGNGVLEPELGELCDPPDGAGCRTDCTTAGCGDARVDLGERCDGGAAPLDALTSCDLNCNWALCGNGRLDPGEACDGGPGCAADCTFVGCGGVALTVGWDVTLVRLDDGRVIGMGPDEHGEQGAPTARGPANVPDVVVGADRFVRRSIGYRNGAGITGSGQLFAWGSTEWGLPGLATTSEDLRPPTQLAPSLRFVDVAVATAAAAAIAEDGSLYTWGREYAGALGGGEGTEPCDGGNWTCRITPARIGPEGVRFDAVRGFSSAFLARDDQGRLWGWGSNALLQLGDPATAGWTCPELDPVNGASCIREPALIDEGPVTDFCVAGPASIVLRDGVLWGRGGEQVLGYGDPPVYRASLQPIPLPAGEEGTRFSAVACGELAWFATTEDGRLLAFGANGTEGLLGLGDAIGNHVGSGVVALPARVRAVGSGWRHTAALLEDGSVWSWGGGFEYRLGLNDLANHASPQESFLTCP